MERGQLFPVRLPRHPPPAAPPAQRATETATEPPGAGAPAGAAHGAQHAKRRQPCSRLVLDTLAASPAVRRAFFSQLPTDALWRLRRVCVATRAWVEEALHSAVRAAALAPLFPRHALLHTYRTDRSRVPSR